MDDRAAFNVGAEWYDYVAHYKYRSATDIDPLYAAVFGSPTTRLNDQLLRRGWPVLCGIRLRADQCFEARRRSISRCAGMRSDSAPRSVTTRSPRA